MYKQICTAALAGIAAIGIVNLASAQEQKAIAGEKQLTNSIGMKLTLIPSGEFMMGREESAEDVTAFFKKNFGEKTLYPEFFNNEHPQHRVRITKPFYMGTYHVTRGQFRQFVKESGYKTDAENPANPGVWGWNTGMKTFHFSEKFSWQFTGFEQTDEHPVVNLSWNDAMAFCKWLSAKEGKSYQLPTEAQWEYACRAGTKTRYYSGDEPDTLAKVGNVSDATAKRSDAGWWFELSIHTGDGYVFTAPVGQFQPNAFGLFDMHGNARQWCSDWYSETYYGESPEADPDGPANGSEHVLRGGDWHDRPSFNRSAHRLALGPDYQISGPGFRVVRTP